MFDTTARDSLPPMDQADGLRRLFAGSSTRFIAVAANPNVAFAGEQVERLAALLEIACSREDPSPGRGELETVRPSVEQATSQTALERRELPAHGRLAHAEARGSRGEAAGVGSGQEEAICVPVTWVMHP